MIIFSRANSLWCGEWQEGALSEEIERFVMKSKRDRTVFDAGHRINQSKNDAGHRIKHIRQDGSGLCPSMDQIKGRS